MGSIKGGKLTLKGQPFITDDGTGAPKPYTGGHPQAPSDGVPPQG
jgi:hypothetical protein